MVRASIWVFYSGHNGGLDYYRRCIHAALYLVKNVINRIPIPLNAPVVNVSPHKNHFSANGWMSVDAAFLVNGVSLYISQCADANEWRSLPALQYF